MNASKAREYFSAYYEGNLEAGLKQQLEKSMESDRDLQGDYAQFVQTMELLSNFDESEIVVPADLGEQIARKLDHHIWEQQQTAKPGFFAQWRMVLVGGVAVLAIGATLYSFGPGAGKNGPMGAGIGGSGDVKTTSADLTYRSGEIRLVVNNGLGLSMTVLVKNAVTGEVVYEGDLKGSNLDNPLTNGQAEPAVLDITFDGKIDPLVVVLPGQDSDKTLTGSGTAVDLAKAIAQSYRTPVLLRLKDRSLPMEWDFDETLTADGLPAALGGQKAKVTVRNDGFLVLSD